MYKNISIDKLYADETNPRKADPHRLYLLQLSLSRLGFLMPIYATKEGMVLSGHQRLTVAKMLGCSHIPCAIIDLPERDIKGINILFNRATNDFGALTTGTNSLSNLNCEVLVQEASELPSMLPPPKTGITDSYFFANACKVENVAYLAQDLSHLYDKKAVVVAENFIRKGIHIPIVVSEGRKEVVNGVHRLLAALENGITEWPVVWVPDSIAEYARHFLNYLSMDFHVDDTLEKVLRYSAYRRPQNNRGLVPKAYRFWGNGCKTLPDSESYSTKYWAKFRELHGRNIIDFGAGLGKVAPALNSKGMNCIDFEPYRIDPSAEAKKPSPAYSREKAREFLIAIADKDFIPDSIFLASVMNSVPFPRDRMCVLAIVHALSATHTAIYGTCRDISDFTYEYGGIRQANYFVFDSEPGVRLGDALHNPKIQKFHSPKEMEKLLSQLWVDMQFWPGGNVFYYKASNPKRINTKVLKEALMFEFNDLPYADGSTMGLGELAIECFSKRLGVPIG